MRDRDFQKGGSPIADSRSGARETIFRCRPTNAGRLETCQSASHRAPLSPDVQPESQPASYSESYDTPNIVKLCRTSLRWIRFQAVGKGPPDSQSSCIAHVSLANPALVG